MRVNWTERLEGRGVSRLNTPTASSEPPAQGRGGRQGKHAAHHNAEGPPPPELLQKNKKKKKRAKSSQGKIAWAAWGGGGKGCGGEEGVGCGQREEQAPVTERETAGWDGWRATPSSKAFAPPAGPGYAEVSVARREVDITAQRTNKHWAQTNRHQKHRTQRQMISTFISSVSSETCKHGADLSGRRDYEHLAASGEPGVILPRVSERVRLSSARSFACRLLLVSVLSLTTPSFVCVCVSRGKGKE